VRVDEERVHPVRVEGRPDWFGDRSPDGDGRALRVAAASPGRVLSTARMYSDCPLMLRRAEDAGDKCKTHYLLVRCRLSLFLQDPDDCM
jgi:hypothetical protein